MILEIEAWDWEVVKSGLLDPFVPPRPFERDEAVEYDTLDLLQQRLRMLAKRAWDTTQKAMQLETRLFSRKGAIIKGCQALEPANAGGSARGEPQGGNDGKSNGDDFSANPATVVAQ